MIHSVATVSAVQSATIPQQTTALKKWVTYSPVIKRLKASPVRNSKLNSYITTQVRPPFFNLHKPILAMAAGGKDELQLLGSWYSPYVIRVKVALGLKGLSYEYVEQDLFDKSELLLRHNPVHKKVPVLIHGGKAVCESLVVVQYVDEAWAGTGPALLPADAHDRATARFWAAYVDDKFFQPWRDLFRSTTEEQRAEAFRSTVPQVETLERAFWECSKGKGFFGGDAVGLVDVALGSFLLWFKVVDEVAGTNLLDEAKFPGLAAWAERFLAVDAVKEAMPDVGKLLEHYKGFQAKLATPAAPAVYSS